MLTNIPQNNQQDERRFIYKPEVTRILATKIYVGSRTQTLSLTTINKFTYENEGTMLYIE